MGDGDGVVDVGRGVDVLPALHPVPLCGEGHGTQKKPGVVLMGTSGAMGGRGLPVPCYFLAISTLWSLMA